MKRILLFLFFAAVAFGQQSFGPTIGELMAHERCLMWYVELKDDTPVEQACPAPKPVFLTPHIDEQPWNIMIPMPPGYRPGRSVASRSADSTDEWQPRKAGGLHRQKRRVAIAPRQK